MPINAIPEGVLSSCNVFPALTAKNVAGITPKKVAIMNGIRGTPKRGADRLMNQLGRKGVILKNRISNEKSTTGR